MDIIPGKVIVLLGLAGLAHTAFSVVQHRTYLKITEQGFTGIPADITLQCILSLLLCLYGVVKSTGKFSEIHATAQLATRSFDSISNRPSFHIFQHRGQALHSSHDVDVVSLDSRTAS
ncbi:ER membrane protein complex subunit 5-like [Sycon ciliatum]|uniref:ER membrane protein complex subunit 5-like n=1 Tax=Sycon ciliatum TaxID=27933 RepID=UPI0031F621E5|eukprot:scpid84933/ scgid25760/ Membrane magnesium transporter 2